MDVLDLTENDVHHMGAENFRKFGTGLLQLWEQDRKENALRWYRPTNAKSAQVHEATERVIGVGGGNGSSKTETCLVEMLIVATGIVPDSLKHIDYRKKFRGPRKQRIVVESLTTTLHQVILPKLKWWEWDGVDEPGGMRGHFGWIPRWALIDGSWDRSWSEKLRTLKFKCFNPDNLDECVGESSIQFMSHDQDPSDFASGNFHEVLHDEPPRYSIWRENEARTMRVKGRMLLAMTWPDDPAIPVDWIHEKVFERGQGPTKHKNYKWVNLWTTENPYQDQESVSDQAEAWDDQTKAVRIYGQTIRFSNRVHPLFTDEPDWWCYGCKARSMPNDIEDPKCAKCGSPNLQLFCHTGDWDVEPNWPTVFMLDPHPRKPHYMSWWQVSPYDDLWQRAELLVDDDTEAVAEQVFKLEEQYGLAIAARLMDPNMGGSPANATRREQTWQDEFGEVGIACDFADDSAVGRKVINQKMKPDERTHDVGIHIDNRCVKSITQIKRYVWEDYKESLEKDQKQKPRDKNDDFPALMKYLVNARFTFNGLRYGGIITGRRGARQSARTSRRTHHGRAAIAR